MNAGGEARPGGREPGWGELQRLLLAATPEALEQALELAVVLCRRKSATPPPDGLSVVERCRKLAAQAAQHYLRLTERIEVRTAGYDAGGHIRSAEGLPGRVDARA